MLLESLLLLEGINLNNLHLIESHGPEHEKTFIINVILPPDQTWNGVGSTKKSAEQDGAQKALNTLLGS